MLRLAYCLLLILTAGPVFGQPSFVGQALSVDPPLEANSVLEWFDSEGDGDMDFLAFYPVDALEGRHNIRLYVNTNQNFQGIENPISGGLNIAAGTFFVADGDQDNDADILYTQYGQIKFAWNNGDNTFTSQSSGRLVSQDNVNVYWVDMDGDLDLDLVSSFQDTYISWNTEGTYSEEVSLNISLLAISFADINNDGLTDLFALSYSDGNPRLPTIMIATGRGKMSRTFIPTTIEFPFEVKSRWGDVDNDKDLDLFLLDMDGKWTIFRNQFTETGTPTFELAFQCAALSNPGADLGDVDSDGRLDFIISGSPKTLLYLNQSSPGTIQFQQNDLLIAPTGQTSLQMIDIDQVNGLDFLFSTNESSAGRVQTFYLNTLSNPSPAPGIPTDLAEDGSTPGVLRLSWSHPDHARLSYRLEVFKEGIRIAASESLESGRLRRIKRIPPQLSQTMNLKIEGVGNYSWRIQAVDGAQQASAFSGLRQIQIAMPTMPLAANPPIEPGTELEWTDLDGDGDMDILAFYSGSVPGTTRIRLYENINSAFQGNDSPILVAGNMQAVSYAIADDDHDNDADILYVENRRIKIARNNGDKTFTVLETGIQTEWDGAHAYWADMDGDAGLDLLVEFTNSNFSVIWNREGAYTGRLDYATRFYAAFPADMSNDGLSDFFMVREGGVLAYAVNQGKGRINVLNIDNGYEVGTKAKWIDIDNDQDLDFLILKGTGQWQLFRNNFSSSGITGFFSPQSIGLTDSPALDAADVDSDGFPDVLVAGQQTFLYLNRPVQSGVVFDALNLGISASGKTTVSFIDVDANAGVDFLYSTENAAGTSVDYTFYLNTLAIVSAPPAVPSGLAETPGTNGYLRLTWTHGGKATYRLELSKDGKRITSSESLDSGKPRRTDGGYLLLSRQIDFYNLLAGTYTWRVQAVDASKRGSAFSEARQVVISESNQAPFQSYPLSVTPPLVPDDNLEWLDTDGDGDLDILAFRRSSGKYSVTLYVNNGGRFIGNTSPLLDVPNMEATAYYMGDGNRDNLIDFIFIENLRIKMAMNNGNNTFTIQDTGIVITTDQGTIQWLDVDADSDLDIITMLTNSNYALLLNQQINPGSGGVNYPQDFSSLTMAELDNNRVMDFLLISYSAGYIVQSVSLTDGNFAVINGIGFTPHPKLYWSDADKDGDVDMFALGSSGWKLFKNELKQTGLTRLQIAYSFPTSSPMADVGDVDSDGLPDFVFVEPLGDEGAVRVYLNKSTASTTDFQFKNPGIWTLYNTDISLQHIDADMKLDLILKDGLRTEAYKNTLLNPSPAPQPPTNPQGSYSGGALLLSWTSAGQGLNYRIDLSKDGIPYVASGSANDGKLLKARLSPLLVTNHITFSKLPSGTYTWRVQSVDASNRGSTFTSPQQVTVGPSPVDPLTGLKEYLMPGTLHVFPNPAREEAFLNLPASGKLLIRNPNGQAVFTADYEFAQETVVRIPTATWTPGVYLVEFDQGANRSTAKIVVVR